MDLAANAAHERHQLRKARDEHMFSGMPPIAARKRAVRTLTFSAITRHIGDGAGSDCRVTDRGTLNASPRESTNKIDTAGTRHDVIALCSHVSAGLTRSVPCCRRQQRRTRPHGQPYPKGPKSAIRFLFTQTLPAGRGIFSPFCVSERAPPVRYALRRQFRSHPQAFWGVLAAAPPLTPSSWRQRRRECRTRDHDVSGMTHPSCMKRTQRSRIAVNTASMAELIFKNVCLPCRTILPAV